MTIADVSIPWTDLGRLYGLEAAVHTISRCLTGYYAVPRKIALMMINLCMVLPAASRTLSVCGGGGLGWLWCGVRRMWVEAAACALLLLS